MDCLNLPWGFAWSNTTVRNPGSGSFANPKYTNVVARRFDVRDISDFPDNDCTYYSKSRTSIWTTDCKDVQGQTWFGYATTTAPLNGVSI